MKYNTLNKEEFDALVTGELTHYALWLEGEVNNIISDYFITDNRKRSEFERFLLHRDGLTFQDKIEIVRSMLPLFSVVAEELDLKSLLNEIEEFKSWRNALAHGLDVSPDDKAPLIRVEVVTRAGKVRVYEITPESHETTMKKTEDLLVRVQQARKKLNAGKK